MRRTLVAVAILAVAAAAPPAAAAPAPRLTRGVSDGPSFLNARLGPVALARGRRAGAQVARLPLAWPTVERWWRAPSDPLDPADPAYDFAAFDALVRATVREGLDPLVRIGGSPPRYEAIPRWRFAALGTWAPDPAAYGRFATAAARRYSGRFPDPLHPGRTLPRVRLWQAWNEPNLPRFLQPQWVARRGEWTAFSPAHYRRILNAFYAAVKAVSRSNVVVTAGTAPNGDPLDGQGRMSPVRFWGALLCVTEPCLEPPSFDVLAHHPLSRTGPDVPAAEAGDIAIADIHKLRRLLKAAGRRDTRLWVTELNWDAAVNDSTLQRWIPRALYRLWSEDVELVTWQFVRDPPTRLEHPAGLYAIDRAHPLDPARDRPKRAVLRAFRFPFTGTRRDRGHVALWALLPRPGAARRVAVQRRSGGRWRTVAHLRANRHGLVRGTVAIRGAAQLRLSTRRAGASGAWRAPAA